MPVFVKASRRAKAYTRRTAVKGFSDPGARRARPLKGFPEYIKKGGRIFGRHMFSRDRAKIEKHIRQSMNPNSSTKYVMRGNAHGFAAYQATDYLQTKFKK